MNLHQRILRFWSAVILVAGTPLVALARRVEEEREIVDARLEGYDKINISLPPASTALLWLLLLFLCAVCISVMFKDARRSHLD